MKSKNKKAMKRKKVAYNIILIILILTVNTSLEAKNTNQQSATLDKEFNVKPEMILDLVTKKGNVTVNVWQEDKVKITGELTFNSIEEDDIKTIKEAFKDIIVDESNQFLKLNTNFSISKSYIMGVPVTKLNGKKKVSASDIKIKYTLWIPESMGFYYASKYNKVNTGKLKGKVKIDLYNGELEMEEIGSEFDIILKYTKAFLGDGGNGRMELYDCEIEAGKVGSLEVISKYSKLEFDAISNLKSESYEDKFYITNCTDFQTIGKYTDYTINSDLNLVELEIYECNLDLEDIERLKIQSRYGTIIAHNLGSMFSSELYEDEFKLQSIKELESLNSKYVDFLIDTVYTSVKLREAYETDIHILAVQPKFESFEGNMKYGSVILKFLDSPAYEIQLEANYGDINIPASQLINKELVKAGSNYTLKGKTSENASCQLKFNTYSTDISIE